MDADRNDQPVDQAASLLHDIQMTIEAPNYASPN